MVTERRKERMRRGKGKGERRRGGGRKGKRREQVGKGKKMFCYSNCLGW